MIKNINSMFSVVFFNAAYGQMQSEIMEPDKPKVRTNEDMNSTDPRLQPTPSIANEEEPTNDDDQSWLVDISNCFTGESDRFTLSCLQERTIYCNRNYFEGNNVCGLIKPIE